MKTFKEKYGEVTTEAAMLQVLEEIRDLLTSTPEQTKVAPKRKSYYKKKTPAKKSS